MISESASTGTPTPDREREALRIPVGTVLANSSNFPEKVQSRLLGQDMGPLIDRVLDAILAAGFRRPSTPGDNADIIEGIHMIVAMCNLERNGATGSNTYEIAERILAKYSVDQLEASRPRVVTTAEELDALPVGTLIEAAYDGGSMQILRVTDNGAGAGGASLRGGKFWSETWGWAKSITVLFTPAAKEN